MDYKKEYVFLYQALLKLESAAYHGKIEKLKEINRTEFSPLYDKIFSRVMSKNLNALDNLFDSARNMFLEINNVNFHTPEILDDYKKHYETTSKKIKNQLDNEF